MDLGLAAGRYSGTILLDLDREVAKEMEANRRVGGSSASGRRRSEVRVGSSSGVRDVPG
jgi:hypothetical protein